MQIAIRRMGKATGIILPAPLLAELSVKTGDAMTVTLENGRLILTPANRHPRDGWADATKTIAAAGDDALVWTEPDNASGSNLEW